MIGAVSGQKQHPLIVIATLNDHPRRVAKRGRYSMLMFYPQAIQFVEPGTTNNCQHKKRHILPAASIPMPSPKGYSPFRQGRITGLRTCIIDGLKT